MADVVASGLILSIVALVLTYGAMSLNLPLSDSTLATMDTALGFNWMAFIEFVDSRPWLAEFLNVAYRSFPYQLLLIPIVLCGTANVHRACTYIAGYGSICLISSIVTIWFPALGTYVMYGLGEADLHNIEIHFDFAFLNDFHAVRSGDFNLAMGTASGIVTFPSVHAAIAVLNIWAM